MKPAISVIVPVRDRVDLIHHMMETLVTTAECPELVEVVFRCDDDDEACIAYLRNRRITGWFSGTFGSSFIIGSRLNGYATLPVFINEAARLSRADLVLVINDDAEFVTPGWDTKLVAVAATYPDGIFDLGVVTANADNFIFPCVSRRQIEILGCVFDERLVYTDIWLRDVLLPFERAIRVLDVRIDHRWLGMSDDQQAAVQLVQSVEYTRLYERCVSEGRDKIRKVLQEVTC